MIRRLAVLLLTALTVAACGPVPQPFRQTAPTSLAENRTALLPILVKPVDGIPGLAEAVARSLLKEDLAATTTAAGSAVMLLEGRMDSPAVLKRLGWRVSSPSGEDLGRFLSPLTGRPDDPAAVERMGQSVASVVARLLRGDDSGLADIEARPLVQLLPIHITGNFDSFALSRAMQDALAGQGFKVADRDARFRIQGELRVIDSQGSKDSVVDVVWKVLDGAGKEMGTVSQGSPVAREILESPMAPLARQIAAAGAEGIAEVIRQLAPQ